MTLTRIGFGENGPFRNGFGAERRQGPTRGHRILNTSVPVSFRSSGPGPGMGFRSFPGLSFRSRSGRVPVVSGPGVFRSFPVLPRCFGSILLVFVFLLGFLSVRIYLPSVLRALFLPLKGFLFPATPFKFCQFSSSFFYTYTYVMSWLFLVPFLSPMRYFLGLSSVPCLSVWTPVWYSVPSSPAFSWIGPRTSIESPSKWYPFSRLPSLHVSVLYALFAWLGVNFNVGTKTADMACNCMVAFQVFKSRSLTTCNICARTIMV